VSHVGQNRVLLPVLVNNFFVYTLLKSMVYFMAWLLLSLCR